MNEATQHHGPSASQQRTTLGRGWLTMVIVAIAGHLALLIVGRAVVSAMTEGRADRALVPLASSIAAIVLVAPIALRLLRNRAAKAWWLVAPAILVLAIGALRASLGGGGDATSLPNAALTAFGASLSLSAAAAALAVRATVFSSTFRRSAAALPLLVGFGGLLVVSVAGVRHATAALLALPCSIIGVTAIAVAAGARAERRARFPGASDAILISWISLGAIALASFATAAAAFAASADGVPPLGTHRTVVIAWLHSFPVVAAMIAGFGLRLTHIGNAARASKLDVIGTVVLLVIAVATARNQIQAAFARGNNEGAAAPSASVLPASSPPLAPSTAPSVVPASPAVAPPRPVVLERHGIRLGEPAVDGPMLARDAVAGVERTLERMRGCYDRLGKDKKPGKGELKFVVDPAGSVAHVELQNSELPEALAKCTSLELYRTGFASPAGGRATVLMPIEFVDVP